MRRSTLILFCFLAIFRATAANAADDWAVAMEWVGKYPSESVGKRQRGLLQQPAIDRSLKKLLPKIELSNIAKLTVETPVENIDGLLVLNICRPRNCPADLAMIVIDVPSKRMWVGSFTRELSRVSTRWYGNGDDYTILPEHIRKKFLASHGD
jgi:hypothetical protein